MDRPPAPSAILGPVRNEDSVRVKAASGDGISTVGARTASMVHWLRPNSTRRTLVYTSKNLGKLRE